MLTLSSFVLSLALSAGAANAEDSVDASVSGDGAISALVGDADSAGKKKKGKGGSKGSQQGGSKGSAEGGSKGSSEGGSKESGKGEGSAQRAPAGPGQTGPAQPGSSTGGQPEKRESSEGNTSRDRQAPSRETVSPGRSAGERTGTAPSSSAKPTERRTHAVNTNSGHQSGGGASSERRPTNSHASPNYRGSTGNAVRDSRAIRSHTQRDAAKRAPAVRHVAASHHAAAVRHGSHASHHAAWNAHHGPRYWYSPWRVGHRHYWYHGVFVYGPPVVVVGGSGGGGGGEGASSEARMPKRAVDRAGKFSLGLRGSSYLSGFTNGSGYGDAGIGIAARYRPIDAIGFEAQWTYHDATWSEGSARVQQPLSLSAELFGFPWSRVNPYVLAGVTMTDRNVDQPLPGGTFQAEDSLWGPHAGLGLEFNVGKSASINLDARFIGYVNKDLDDPARAGAVQANAGLNFYF